MQGLLDDKTLRDLAAQVAARQRELPTAEARIRVTIDDSVLPVGGLWFLLDYVVMGRKYSLYQSPGRTLVIRSDLGEVRVDPFELVHGAAVALHNFRLEDAHAVD